MAKLQMILEGEGLSTRSSCPIKLNKNSTTITVDISRSLNQQLRITLSRDEIVRIHAWSERKLKQ